MTYKEHLYQVARELDEDPVNFRNAVMAYFEGTKHIMDHALLDEITYVQIPYVGVLQQHPKALVLKLSVKLRKAQSVEEWEVYRKMINLLVEKHGPSIERVVYNKKIPKEAPGDLPRVSDVLEGYPKG